MYSKIFNPGSRLQNSELDAVLDAIEVFENETGYEFYVLIVDSVEGKRYEAHARSMRLKRTHSIDNI